MDLEQIDRVAQEVMGSRVAHPTREPGWLYHHGVRVGKLALWLADAAGEHPDRDVLTVAAAFHDVGKGDEPHPETGAVLLRTLLADHCTPAQLDAIAELVRGHNRRGDPHAPAALKLLQDADILDHVGPIGTWLAFYWSGAQGESMAQHSAFILGEENAAYRVKLRSRLNYAPARAEFDRRIAYEDAFFTTFRQAYIDGVFVLPALAPLP